MIDGSPIVTPRTLLSRTWVPGCLLAIGFYVILQGLIQVDHLYSSNPVCQSGQFSFLAWLMETLSAMSFLIKAILLCSQWISIGRQFRGSSVDLTGIFATNFTITFLAGSASFLSAGWSWGGTCEDPFGVSIHATQISEWITCVPLLYYVVIALDDKESFSKRDKVAIVSIFIAMTSLGITQLAISFATFIFFFVTAHIFCILGMYILITGNHNISINNSEEPHLDEESGQIIGGNSRIRARLCLLLVCTMPLFPIVYYLAWSNVIGSQITIFLFVLLNLIVKLVFTSLVMDCHIELLYQSFQAQQTRANVARQGFLRYIMHEVRVPL
eukprot:gene9292-19286_t